MEEEFQILLEYKKAQEEAKVKRLLEMKVGGGGEGDDGEEEEEKEEEEAKVCPHYDQVVHEGSYVCTSCGLVLSQVFMPEVNWSDRCVMPSIYSASDRLGAVDKHLAWFLEKSGIRATLHPVQERLRFMKKECRYKSINYALALMCILEGDPESQEKLRPYLPKSHAAWARSSRIMKPLSNFFITSWLDHLMINAKQLSTSQWKRFHTNVALFQTEQSNLMRDMIVDYGCHQDDDLHRLPHELQYALYRFSCVILK